MTIQIVSSPISKKELGNIAQEQFGDFVKAVVDVERGVMALGGDLHADGEAILIENGSRQQNLWGINLWPVKSESEWIEFNSMINVRPSQGNRSRSVESQTEREKILKIVNGLVAE